MHLFHPGHTVLFFHFLKYLPNLKMKAKLLIYEYTSYLAQDLVMYGILGQCLTLGKIL